MRMAIRTETRSARTQAKRERIVECAMRQFAEHGYQGAKVEEIAVELGIAKGSVFQHFGSKAGLFFEAYKQATFQMPASLNALTAPAWNGITHCVVCCLIARPPAPGAPSL